MEFRKLKANEIDCRVSQIASNYCILLLYKDARVDMNILDETVGCLGWKKEYLRDNANCIVSIWDNERGHWVSKEDTGTESFSEAEKGLASDSFKRACFNWGIGRELYTAPFILILPKKDMSQKGKDSEFYCKNPNETDDSKKRYETKTKFWVEYIDYDENREIQNLIIRDHKNNIRFTQLTKEKEKELLQLDKEFNELSTTTKEKAYKLYKADGDTQMLFKNKKEVVESERKEAK